MVTTVAKIKKAPVATAIKTATETKTEAAAGEAGKVVIMMEEMRTTFCSQTAELAAGPVAAAVALAVTGETP